MDECAVERCTRGTAANNNLSVLSRQAAPGSNSTASSHTAPATRASQPRHRLRLTYNNNNPRCRGAALIQVSHISNSANSADAAADTLVTEAQGTEQSRPRQVRSAVERCAE